MKRIMLAVCGVMVMTLPSFTMGSSPSQISSQIVSCSQIVSEALAAADRSCETAGRNQACYGHVQLSAQPQSGVEDFVFDKQGDIVNVADLLSLRVDPMDVGTGSWGIALMRLQASLPINPPVNNITLLVFGNVELENAVTTSTALEVTIVGSRAVDVYNRPSSSSLVVDTLSPGQVVTANGRTADDLWLRIESPNSPSTAWIRRTTAIGQGSIQSLEIVDPLSSYYRPMQAFYFKKGSENSADTCPEKPADGLLIQTPEGVAEVTLLINEVNIQLGSTIFLEGQPGESMTVNVIEGFAQVNAMNTAYKAVAGTSITVPVDNSFIPSGPPSRPQPYDLKMLEALPVKSLARPITIAPPLSQEEADALPQPTVTPEFFIPDNEPQTNVFSGGSFGISKTKTPPPHTPTHTLVRTATKTATRTPTKVPTRTPTFTASRTPTPLPTARLLPTLTWTFTPVPTDTLPPPTDTLVPTLPPTDTAVPPTNTPEPPPTDTPEPPPTNTPEPPPTDTPVPIPTDEPPPTPTSVDIAPLVVTATPTNTEIPVSDPGVGPEPDTGEQDVPVPGDANTE